MSVVDKQICPACTKSWCDRACCLCKEVSPDPSNGAHLCEMCWKLTNTLRFDPSTKFPYAFWMSRPPYYNNHSSELTNTAIMARNCEIKNLALQLFSLGIGVVNEETIPEILARMIQASTYNYEPVSRLPFAHDTTPFPVGPLPWGMLLIFNVENGALGDYEIHQPTTEVLSRYINTRVSVFRRVDSADQWVDLLFTAVKPYINNHDYGSIPTSIKKLIDRANLPPRPDVYRNIVERVPNKIEDLTEWTTQATKLVKLALLEEYMQLLKNPYSTQVVSTLKNKSAHTAVIVPHYEDPSKLLVVDARHYFRSVWTNGLIDTITSAGSWSQVFPWYRVDAVVEFLYEVYGDDDEFNDAAFLSGYLTYEDQELGENDYTDINQSTYDYHDLSKMVDGIPGYLVLLEELSKCSGIWDALFPLDRIQADPDAFSVFLRAVNDAGMLRSLPKPVRMLAHPDSPLIWREYDPCYWRMDDRAQIVENLTKSDWSVIEIGSSRQYPM
jgi:hypothetical protein